MPQGLQLSVVMATYNRAETIRTTLARLADQTLPHDAYELIVIDDGSPDDTEAVVAEFARTAPMALRYLRHANQGPGYTQNRGLREARAPTVLLMADDIWMAPGTLEAHVRFHANPPAPHAVALGQVQQSPTLEGSVFLRTWDPFRFSDLDGATRLPYYKFWACNVSAPRDLLLQVGGFREQRGPAGPAAHEDPELGYRLHQAGMALFYCPAALGHHHHVVSLEQALKRGYMQGLNFPTFRAQVGQPEIAVAYHWLDRTTLRDHFEACRGPRQEHLVPPDRALPKLLARYALRELAFNRLTMATVWKPLAALAERHPAVARRMHPAFYRGMVAYNFFKGARDGRSLVQPAPHAQPTPA